MLSRINKVYTVNEIEYCYNLEKIQPPSARGSLKMWIPKVMSEVPFSSKGVNSKVVFAGHNAVFINDPACRPSCGKTFTTQNYVNVPLQYPGPSDWDEQYGLEIQGRISSKIKFKCMFANGELGRRHFEASL